MAAKSLSQSPLVCHGHSRPIVELSYSAQTEDGVFLVSASKGARQVSRGSELSLGFARLAGRRLATPRFAGGCRESGAACACAVRCCAETESRQTESP